MNIFLQNHKQFNYYGKVNQKRIADLFDESEAENNQYDISFTKLSIWLVGVVMVSSLIAFVFPGGCSLVRTYAYIIILLVVTARPIFRLIVKRKNNNDFSYDR